MSEENYECLIDITSHNRLKQKFCEYPRVEFWCSLLQEYSQLSKCAVLQLLPFPTTQLCKAGCSGYAAKESKYHYRLEDAADMRIELSTSTPNCKGLREANN